MYLFSLVCDLTLMIYSAKIKKYYISLFIPYIFITIFTFFEIFCIFYWDSYFFIGVSLSIFNIYSILI
jgi:hypothetical protein